MVNGKILSSQNCWDFLGGEARLSKYDRSNEEEPKRKWRKWVRGMKLPRKPFDITSSLNLNISPKDGSQEEGKKKEKKKRTEARI